MTAAAPACGPPRARALGQVGRRSDAERRWHRNGRRAADAELARRDLGGGQRASVRCDEDALPLVALSSSLSAANSDGSWQLLILFFQASWRWAMLEEGVFLSIDSSTIAAARAGLQRPRLLLPTRYSHPIFLTACQGISLSAGRRSMTARERHGNKISSERSRAGYCGNIRAHARAPISFFLASSNAALMLGCTECTQRDGDSLSRSFVLWPARRKRQKQQHTQDTNKESGRKLWNHEKVSVHCIKMRKE